MAIYAYPQELRDRVLRALERGEGPTAIAKRLEVSRGWVYQVQGRFESEGKRCSLPMGGYRQSRVAPWESQLRGWIKAEPDLTLEQLCRRLAKQGVSIQVPALWHQLDKWGLSLKKNAARQRARTRGRASGAPRMAEKPADARHR